MICEMTLNIGYLSSVLSTIKDSYHLELNVSAASASRMDIIHNFTEISVRYDACIYTMLTIMLSFRKPVEQIALDVDVVICTERNMLQYLRVSQFTRNLLRNEHRIQA